MIGEFQKLNPGDILVSDKQYAWAPVPEDGCDVRWNPFSGPVGVEVMFTGDKVSRLLVVLHEDTKILVMRHDFKLVK